MEYFRDHEYPNGWIKSRLYEVFLTHHYFGISPEEYEFDLEFIKIDENNGERNCTWFRDPDGRLIVHELQFQDRNVQLGITERGFEFIRKPLTYRRVKIFISYAREDLCSAKRMFDELRSAGLEPWLDKECLLAGERWEVGIEQAIRSSNYFIALLSSNSVAKRGFVQKEIKRALDILDQIPESGIFIIPTRLDNCRPSHSVLAELNWVDLFPDWDIGLRKILKVLKMQG